MPLNSATICGMSVIATFLPQSHVGITPIEMPSTIRTRLFPPVIANVASVGMSGAIAQRANETTKALGGKVSYALATLTVFARWRVGEVNVSVDGESRAGHMHDVIVANGVWHGGGMKLAPDAAPDDGQFDVVLIGDVSKADFLTTAPKIYKGKHVHHPKVEVLRSKRVEVDAPVQLPIEVEGEQVGTTPAAFEAVAGALRVKVPKPPAASAASASS